MAFEAKDVLRHAGEVVGKTVAEVRPGVEGDMLEDQFVDDTDITVIFTDDTKVAFTSCGCCSGVEIVTALGRGAGDE